MEQIIENRNIEWLMHFTIIDNLESILENGLVPRNTLSMLESIGVKPIINDDSRYDSCTDANCMSIEFPNYKMFYTLRCNNPSSEWVVLAFEAKIINDFKCAFCYHNAGDSEIFTIPIEDRMTKNAFEGMFADRNGYPSREQLNIPEYYPTNPQAEILVFGIIPSSYIKYAIFDSNNTLNKYKDMVPSQIKCIVNKDYFFGRCDNEFWKK